MTSFNFSSFLKKTGKFLLFLFLLLNVLVAIQAYHTTYFYEQGIYPFKKPSERTKTENISAALFGLKQSKRNVIGEPAFSYETIKLKDEAGFELEGWYVPKDSAKGTVLLFHGHGSCKAAVINEANYFHEIGYNTFSLDVRSHGNSQGNVCTVGYKEAQNVKLVYDWVQAKGEKNIIIWGASMGASMSIKAIADYQLEPQKVILHCPFASMKEAAKGFLRKAKIPASPLAEMMMFWGSVQRGYWGFNYKPVEYAKKIHSPVLLQWGRNDERVTVEETNAIFNNINTPNKQLVIYENSGHESYCNRENEKWKTTVKSFLEN